MIRFLLIIITAFAKGLGFRLGCETAICDNQRCCPKCGKPVYPHYHLYGEDGEADLLGDHDPAAAKAAEIEREINDAETPAAIDALMKKNHSHLAALGEDRTNTLWGIANRRKFEMGKGQEASRGE